MTKTTKNILKAVMVVALLCPAVFAEGDMGSGGKTCPQGTTCLTGDMGSGGLTSYDTATKTSRTPEGDMGSGGLNGGTDYFDELVRSFYEYFDWTM